MPPRLYEATRSVRLGTLIGEHHAAPQLALAGQIRHDFGERSLLSAKTDITYVTEGSQNHHHFHKEGNYYKLSGEAVKADKNHRFAA